MTDVQAPIRILFVDDDPLVLRAVARALDGTAAVATVPSAEDGVAFLEKNEVDVVVSDLDLPDMNGIDFLGVVRRQHPLAIRMMLTGAPSLDRAIAAINEGELHRFFVKPLDYLAFTRTLQGLSERIATSRRESQREWERSRRHLFFAWVDSEGRKPLVWREASGDLVVDEGMVEASLRASGVDEIIALLDD